MGEGLIPLDFKFRLSANVEGGTVCVEIELKEVGIHIDVTDADLKAAVRTASKHCVKRLAEKGYDTTEENILETLETYLAEAFKKGEN